MLRSFVHLRPNVLFPNTLHNRYLVLLARRDDLPALQSTQRLRQLALRYRVVLAITSRGLALITDRIAHHLIIPIYLPATSMVSVKSLLLTQQLELLMLLDDLLVVGNVVEVRLLLWAW